MANLLTGLLIALVVVPAQITIVVILPWCLRKGYVKDP